MVAAYCIEQHQNIGRNQMKRSLVTVVILLAIFISGCNTSPAPQQGPPGQQGAQGQSGQQGQQGHRGDEGQSGQQGRRGDHGQSGQQGQRGSSAPCPAGQRRYTDPGTGEVRCVRD